MRYIKWLIFNGIFAFIVADGTIGITEYQEYSTNLVPFLVFLFLLLGILLVVVLFVMEFFIDEVEAETIVSLKNGLTRNTTLYLWIDSIYDVVLVLLMAVHGFLLSAIFYFAVFLLSRLAGFLKSRLLDEIEKRKFSVT